MSFVKLLMVTNMFSTQNIFVLKFLLPYFVLFVTTLVLMWFVFSGITLLLLKYRERVEIKKEEGN